MGFKESNKMHTINGYMYCNGPPFALKQGQRARWYVHAVGSDHGMHTPRWYGSSIRLYGRSVAVPELLPGESKAVDMLPDSKGRWLVHCEVHDHAVAGMRAFLDVGMRIHYDKLLNAPNFVQWTPENSCVQCAAGAHSTRWVKCCAADGADGEAAATLAKDVQAWGSGVVAAAILVPAAILGCGLFFHRPHHAASGAPHGCREQVRRRTRRHSQLLVGAAVVCFGFGYQRKAVVRVQNIK